MAEDKAAEIERLKRLLASREGKSGYAKNVAAIRARLAELEGSVDE